MRHIDSQSLFYHSIGLITKIKYINTKSLETYFPVCVLVILSIYNVVIVPSVMFSLQFLCYSFYVVFS